MSAQTAARHVGPTPPKGRPAILRAGASVQSADEGTRLTTAKEGRVEAQEYDADRYFFVLKNGQRYVARAADLDFDDPRLGEAP